MNKFPLSLQKTELPEAVAEAPKPVTVSPFGPFLSFHFSYTEVSSQNGGTRVTSRQTRLEAGKLSTSSFEGELPADAYQQAVNQAQRQFVDQARLMTRSLSWFLPFSMRLPFDRD